MLDLVRKRHDGDGWLVFSELANRPGGHDRYADAFALGVWASHKYEAHLYEFKISREDVKREMRDPTKAEGVGKYATKWWLAINDEKIINDLVIPEAWGIVVAKGTGQARRFVELRKAPKLKPIKFDPLFAVSLIRNMAKTYKSKADYLQLQNRLDDALAMRDIAPMPDIAAKDEQIHRLERELKELNAGIMRFREETGVDLTQKRSFEIGQVGRHLKVATDLQRRIASGDISQEISMLSQTAQRLLDHASELAHGAVALRGLADLGECTPNCRSNSNWGRGQCSCGAQPLSEVERKLAADARDRAGSDQAAQADDDQGGGVDRGGARPPVEDAGSLLRHLGDEVPHGQ